MSTEKNHILYTYFIWVYEIFFRPFFLPGVKRAIERVKIYNPKSIVEVGVGTGYSLEHYPKGIRVVGLDLSDQMVEMSKKRAKKISDKEIILLNTRDLRAKLGEEKFDMVSSYSVLTVVPNPEQFLDQLKNLCAPNGHIMIVMHKRGEGVRLVFDKMCNVFTKFLFGFTTLRSISDYNLEGYQIVEEEPINSFLGYPYSHVVVLKKL